jgi:hypothetical protein
MRSVPDPILRLQLPFIAKIIQDETWLEAERRGHAVSPDDPVVRSNVCAVILRIGAELRARLTRQPDLATSSVSTGSESLNRRAA